MIFETPLWIRALSSHVFYIISFAIKPDHFFTSQFSALYNGVSLFKAMDRFVFTMFRTMLLYQLAWSNLPKAYNTLLCFVYESVHVLRKSMLFYSPSQETEGLHSN